MTPQERAALARALIKTPEPSINTTGGVSPNEAERQALARTLMGYGLGPMTERTQRGLPNPEARAYEPSPGENAGLMARQGIGGTTGERVEPMIRALLDYGPEPAKAYVDQFNKATDAGRDALIDPSASSIGNAAVQTGAALFNPQLMMAGGALGFGDALVKDLGLGATSPAEAQQRRKAAPQAGAETPDLPGLNSDEQPAYKAAVKELANPEWMRREARQALKERVQGFEKRAADRAEGERRLQEESGRAKQQAEQGEYDRRVQMAEVLRGKAEGKDWSFDDTAFGGFYRKVGGAAPFLAAAGAGALGRLAHGPAKSMLPSYGEGVGGALIGTNLPDITNAFFTPAENMRKRALEDYGNELPPEHPRKQESLDAAGRMPTVSPSRTASMETLSDPWALAGRGAMALAEGVGGPIGAGAINLPRRLGRSIAEDGLFGFKERAVRGAIAPVAPSPSPLGSGPVGTPMPPGGGPAAGPSTTSQIPPHPIAPPLPGRPATPARNQPAQQSPSKSPAYSPEHSDVSRTVIADYLRTGKVPDAQQMRTDIRSAIEQAGLPKVSDVTLLKKANETEGLVRALLGAPAANQTAALDATLGRGRFLAVPAAGATAAVADQEQRDALARVLRGF